MEVAKLVYLAKDISSEERLHQKIKGYKAKLELLEHLYEKSSEKRQKQHIRLTEIQRNKLN